MVEIDEFLSLDRMLLTLRSGHADNEALSPGRAGPRSGSGVRPYSAMPGRTRSSQVCGKCSTPPELARLAGAAGSLARNASNVALTSVSSGAVTPN